jgi:hypothetical protein
VFVRDQMEKVNDVYGLEIRPLVESAHFISRCSKHMLNPSVHVLNTIIRVIQNYYICTTTPMKLYKDTAPSCHMIVSSARQQQHTAMTLRHIARRTASSSD